MIDDSVHRIATPPQTTKPQAQTIVYERDATSPKSTPNHVFDAARFSPRSMAKVNKETTSPKPTARNNMHSAAGTPILPASERRLHEDKVGLRSRKGSEVDKWDIPTDGREGRQFTVANVGNNGKIYLRYAPNHLLDLVASSCAGL
jgi:hypothetical protein